MQTSDLDGSSEEALIAGDNLARSFLASMDALHFDIAREQSQREAVYRLRYQAVIERRWAQPADLPDGMESDLYDEKAIHIIGMDGDKLAATSRLVLPDAVARLPTEEAFHMQVEPHGQVVDMGRQIVAREYTSIKHIAFAALLAKTWLEIRAHGYSRVCGDFSPAMIRLYRMMGFHVKQIGPAQPFWGEERAPIMVDIVESMMALVERWGNNNSPG